MNFEIPNEMLIIDGICQLNCEIFNYEDVHSFLIDNVVNKSVVDRFVSWLISLRIIPHTRRNWGQNLYNMSTQYFDRVNFYFQKNPEQPLIACNFDAEESIKEDLKAHSAWFCDLCKQVGIEGKAISNHSLRLSRIYAILLNETRDFEYIKGSIAYGMVFLMLCAVFAKLSNLSMDFAESITYYMTRAFVMLVPTQRVLRNQKKTINHCELIDQMIMSEAKELWDEMKKRNVSSCDFSLKMEVGMFAFQHSAIGIMNIWDQILARITLISEITQCLVISHLRQIKLADNIENLPEYILNYDNWNYIQIIDEAVMKLKHFRSCKETFCLYFCPKLKQFHGYELKNEIY